MHFVDFQDIREHVEKQQNYPAAGAPAPAQLQN
jgi:hypothetical protein